MPHFYFDVYNDDVTRDDEGLDLLDAAAARERGVLEARHLLSASIRVEGRFVRGHWIEVLDADRERVASIRFGDVVDIV